jgi:hypothetical protein
MANRPLYLPVSARENPRVQIKNIDFTWFAGFSIQQKQKSIESLHTVGQTLGIKSILEVSSKSTEEQGVALSAFNLMIKTRKNKSFSVESAFQSSKVFEHGGPFTELLQSSSIDAKKDIRLKESGNLVSFSFYDRDYPITPRTSFYDWLYINALNHNQKLKSFVLTYQAFTDIEFNPKKSLNCQAYAVALFVSLFKTGMLENALVSFEAFLDILAVEYKLREDSLGIQGSLF